MMKMPTTELTRQDELFHALDGRCVTAGERSWVLHLQSVRLVDAALWLQLDLLGAPVFVLTVREAADADARAILRTLTQYVSRSMTSDPLVFDRILTVGSSEAPARHRQRWIETSHEAGLNPVS